MKALNSILTRFRKCLKAKRKANIKFLGKHRVLKSNHVEFLSHLLEGPVKQPITLTEMKEHLRKEFSELDHIAKSTIARCLKRNLRMSHKKLSVAAPRLFRSEDVSKIIMCSCVIQQLVENGIDVIFVDEFSVSERGYRTYGWCERSKKGMYLHSPSPLRCSFIVALSERSFYNVLGTDGTF